MKLLYGPPSPYSRKVRIVALEKGLEDRIEFIACNPFERPELARSQNPQGKVPSLETDAHGCLYDSPVICAYLDTLCEYNLMHPVQGSEKWIALRRQALCDGIMDFTYALAMELRRDTSLQSSVWIARQVKSICRSLDQLECEIAEIGQKFDIASVSAICALDYIDLRASSYIDWREKRPGLVGFHEVVSARPSIMATHPVV